MNFRKKNRPYMLLSAAVVALGVTMLTAYVSYRYGHSTAVADAATTTKGAAKTAMTTSSPPTIPSCWKWNA